MICDGQSLKLKTVEVVGPRRKLRVLRKNEVGGAIHGGWNIFKAGSLTIDQSSPNLQGKL